MKYLSLFSGIGGFELGIQQAYVSLSKTKGKQQGRNQKNKPVHGESFLGPQCIGFSEIDKYATQIYQRHFPNHQNYGDITKINPQELPDFDFLCGGFPCQTFSIAGKRKGFEEARGTLFFDICRILAHKRPRRLLLENVKGLLSHDHGKTFRTIIATLDELGYDLQWQVLNSKDFGVPQNRERVLIVGHFRGTPRPEVFPIGASDALNGEVREGKNKERPRASCLSTRYGQRWTDETYIGTYRTHNDGKGFRKSKSGLAPTIPARAREDGSGQPVVMQKGEMRIRRLTPTECERLQGFPDGWTQGVSDTQRYKCLGNAVTTNVIQAVTERLLSNK